MTVTTCDRCQETIGAPHTLLDTDCILGHADHAERFAGYACKRHYHWINDTLYQIGELFALLDDVRLPGPASDIRSGTMDGSPAPGRVEVMALTDPRAKTPIDLDGEDDVPDLPGSLSSWAVMVIHEQTEDDLDARERRVAMIDGTVVRSVSFLRRERMWIAAQPWLDDYVSELAALHRAVALAVGDSMWPRPIGKCPNDQAPLYNTVGLDQVTCRRCKATWSGVHLARLRLIHEREAAQ